MRTFTNWKDLIQNTFDCSHENKPFLRFPEISREEFLDIFFDDLELPEVQRKVEEPKVVASNIAYFVDGELSTKEEVEALDNEIIESVNVVKDSVQIKELNTQNNAIYSGIIEVTLKTNN